MCAQVFVCVCSYLFMGIHILPKCLCCVYGAWVVACVYVFDCVGVCVRKCLCVCVFLPLYGYCVNERERDALTLC